MVLSWLMALHGAVSQEEAEKEKNAALAAGYLSKASIKIQRFLCGRHLSLYDL